MYFKYWRTLGLPSCKHTRISTTNSVDQESFGFHKVLPPNNCVGALCYIFGSLWGHPVPMIVRSVIPFSLNKKFHQRRSVLFPGFCLISSHHPAKLSLYELSVQSWGMFCLHYMHVALNSNTVNVPLRPIWGTLVNCTCSLCHKWKHVESQFHVFAIRRRSFELTATHLCFVTDSEKSLMHTFSVAISISIPRKASHTQYPFRHILSQNVRILLGQLLTLRHFKHNWQLPGPSEFSCTNVIFSSLSLVPNLWDQSSISSCL